MGVSVTPERPEEQRKRALEAANKIRKYRANLKLDLKAGRLEISELLLNPPQEILTMKLTELLLALHRFSDFRVDRVLKKARVYSSAKTVGALTDRQREELAFLLRR